MLALNFATHDEPHRFTREAHWSRWPMGSSGVSCCLSPWTRPIGPPEWKPRRLPCWLHGRPSMRTKSNSTAWFRPFQVFYHFRNLVIGATESACQYFGVCRSKTGADASGRRKARRRLHGRVRPYRWRRRDGRVRARAGGARQGRSRRGAYIRASVAAARRIKVNGVRS